MNFKKFILFVLLFSVTLSFNLSKFSSGQESDYEWREINNGLYGGHIHYLVIDPLNSNVIYAGTEDGGVFKTILGGKEWIKLKIEKGDFSTYSAVLNPKDTKIVNVSIVYVAVWGYGIYKSNDAGVTWERVNKDYMGNIITLAIDPQNPEILYAGDTSKGIYKSTDGGVNWKNINNGLTNLRIKCLEVNPINTKILFTGTSKGIFKSSDGGETWIEVNTENKDLSYQDIAIDPFDSNTAYAGTSNGIYNLTLQII